MKTIDLTPKWEPLIDPIIAILQNKDVDPKTWAFIREELLRLARGADEVNAKRDAEIAEYETAQKLLENKLEESIS